MRAVIGLGSNVGDRHANLRAATSRIAAIATVVARSKIYETAPIGGPTQSDFLNAAVLVECTQTPHALLGALAAIESDLGRVRVERWGPRTIDLDILWIDGPRVDSADLVVPHPRLTERAFALAPLLDVAPDAPFVMFDAASIRRTDLAL